MEDIDQKTVQFSLRWKIEWSQFDNISNLPIVKRFSTVFNDVVIQWRAEINTIQTKTESTKFGFYLRYEDGPHDAMKNINYIIGISKMDKVVINFDAGKYEAVKSKSWGWYNFAERGSTVFKERHGFSKNDSLFCQIVMKIPVNIFSYTYDAPIDEPTPIWMQDLFFDIDDPEKAEFSNAKMISKQGDAFYCDRVILGRQSAAMAAMFRHPPAQNQKPGEFEFPELGTNTLRALLEFFYTGRATFGDFSTSAIIELADAAEQYGLKNLKKSCRVVLWTRATENPDDCFDIACFADLHADMLHVKHRALEVLARNYEIIDFYELAKLNGKYGDFDSAIIGASLKHEFDYHIARRVVGVIPAPKTN